MNSSGIEGEKRIWQHSAIIVKFCWASFFFFSNLIQIKTDIENLNAQCLAKDYFHH